jgi:acyl-CoA thioesterase YciA
MKKEARILAQAARPARPRHSLHFASAKSKNRTGLQSIRRTRQPAIRVVMMPRDANGLGTIFGGVILSSIDLAGVVEARQHSDRKLVTAAMREVKFIAPVFVDDLVSFYTEVIRTGRTSIAVRVTVEATRARAPHRIVRVTQAEVVYVAIDEVGRPVSVRS